MYIITPLKSESCSYSNFKLKSKYAIYSTKNRIADLYFLWTFDQEYFELKEEYIYWTNQCKRTSEYNKKKVVELKQMKSSSDSIIIQKTITTFYKWYLNDINNSDLNQSTPKFIESVKGMTTLGIHTYYDFLKTKPLSDEFIRNDLKKYEACIKQLEQIEYSKFKNDWKDLDQFEMINCDFNNTHKWLGGQEAYSKFKIASVFIEESDKAVVQCIFYNQNSKNISIETNRNVSIHLEKIDGVWKIFKIIT